MGKIFSSIIAEITPNRLAYTGRCINSKAIMYYYAIILSKPSKHTIPNFIILLANVCVFIMLIIT